MVANANAVYHHHHQVVEVAKLHSPVGSHGPALVNVFGPNKYGYYSSGYGGYDGGYDNGYGGFGGYGDAGYTDGDAYGYGGSSGGHDGHKHGHKHDKHEHGHGHGHGHGYDKHGSSSYAGDGYGGYSGKKN